MSIFTSLSEPAVHPKSGELVYFAEVTPEQAQDVLATRNTHNRNLKGAGKINGLARDMIEDRFLGLNGETISFDIEGKLTNGQNRLTALVRSGKPQQMTVVENVGLDTLLTVDITSRRSPSDQLLLCGYKNTAAKAAVAKNLLVHRSFGYMTDLGTNSSYIPTDSEVRGFVERNDEDLARAALLTKGKWVEAELKLCVPSVVGAVFFLCYQEEPDEAEEFFAEQLIKGVRLEDESAPALAFRNYNKRQRRKLRKHEQYAFLVKVWNAYVDHAPIRQLSVPNGGWGRANMPTLKFK